MAKRRKDNMTIFLSNDEKSCIQHVFKYFTTKKGLYYILKQIKDVFEIELARDFVKEYLIIQHSKDEKEHIKFKTVKISLKCIGGRFSINEKKKVNLYGAIIENNLWIKYVDYILTVSGSYFTNIKEFLYMINCSPVKICEVIETIFKSAYFHDYIDNREINISKNISQRHIINYFEKNKLLNDYLEYVSKNIEIFVSDKEDIKNKMDEISLRLRENNIFNFENSNIKFEIGRKNNFNNYIKNDIHKKKRDDILMKRRLA